MDREKSNARFDVEHIIDHKFIDNIIYFKVEWTSYPGETTWEPVFHLDDCEDKLNQYYKGLSLSARLELYAKFDEIALMSDQ